MENELKKFCYNSNNEDYVNKNFVYSMLSAIALLEIGGDL